MWTALSPVGQSRSSHPYDVSEMSIAYSRYFSGYHEDLSFGVVLEFAGGF